MSTSPDVIPSSLPSTMLPVVNTECSCSSTAVTSVFVTLLIILIIEAGLYVLWKIYWRGKKGQHLVLVTDSEKGDLYAYDNPGFKEGPSLVPVVEKENQNKTKWALWASGFVPNGNLKVKAMDDSFSSGPIVRVVPLRSRDFTGLGFNICGNIRDGIFIKDVLHRGPASESGHIYPGDRLESVKVCLKHVVLEDALTILSYASPYDVELGVSSSTGNISSRHPSTPGSMAHPFYKSHSISDLQQIEKSSSRRSGEKSITGDGGDPKLSTLEKRSKQEAERYQNTTNYIIESSQKQENVFHTIDLDETDRKESTSPSSMKAMLVKGIQNLKEKLHNSLHQDDEKSSSGNPSRTSTLDKRTQIKKDEGFKTVELTVPEDNYKISVEPFKGVIEVEEVERKRKGKAPTPPQILDEEDVPVVSSIEDIECLDSDNETVQGGRIELDSSHVTVHQAEGEGRKASSLGDLSRYEADKLTVLERAVSLDLADGSGRKRKAPQPPQELTTYKEVEQTASGTLKKSNVWGNLADAICSDSDEEMVENGLNTPENDTELTHINTIQASSTPMKSPTNITIEGLTMASTIPVVPESDSLLDPESMDFSNINGNSSSCGSTPPLPTSPVPDFITEIEILTDRLNDTNDSLQTLTSFQASYSTCREMESPDEKQYKPISFLPSESVNSLRNDYSQKNNINISNDNTNSSKDFNNTSKDYGNFSKHYVNSSKDYTLISKDYPNSSKDYSHGSKDFGNSSGNEYVVASAKTFSNSLTKDSCDPSTELFSEEPILNGSTSYLTDPKEESISLKRVLETNDTKHKEISSTKIFSDQPEPPKRMKSYNTSLDALESPTKIMTTFKSDNTAKKSLDFNLDESFRIQETNKENDKPESSYGTYKVDSKKKEESSETSLANKILRNDLSEKRFSIVEIETENLSQPEISKPPRNVSVTNIKSNTSRIPVRAGARSPGSGKHSPELRRVSDHRNGHHSP